MLGMCLLHIGEVQSARDAFYYSAVQFKDPASFLALGDCNLDLQIGVGEALRVSFILLYMLTVIIYDNAL